MAEYALIDGYLETLRSSIRWRRDLEDVLAEMEDHLISAAEGLEARGTDRVVAQRDTLNRFGDPKVLAVAFASTPTGGTAVPTSFTRTAGTTAIASAITWVAALTVLGIAAVVPSSFRSDPTAFIPDAETIATMIGATLVLLAGVFLIVTLVGLVRRHGGLGAIGMIGFGISTLGVVASFIIWAVVLWMPLMGIGLVVFSFAVLQRDIAPRIPTALLGGGMLTGSVLFFVLRWLEVGQPDQWGDYPLAYGIGITVGVVTTAIALLGIGRWLRSEEPIDLPTEPLTTA